MKQIIFWITAVVILTLGAFGCSPVEPNNGNEGEPFYFGYKIYVTNHSDNEISVIEKGAAFKMTYTTPLEIWYLNEWYEVKEVTNNIFEAGTEPNFKLMYGSGVPEGYDISKRGSIIGIITENKTNYLVGFEETIARELMSEITNDTLIYGFAYVKRDRELPFSSQDSFRCDLLPDDVETSSVADYVITVSNDTIALNVIFGGLKYVTNIITNIPYSN
jgi:hypothetical protein